MKFTKMHGIGNDYVYVNGFEEKIDNKPDVAVYVSDRHFGIGSDGLIFINPSDEADFEMEMYNSDGSRAEMCGNGIRCVAKYAYDYRLTDKTEFKINTLAGIKTVKLTVDNTTNTAQTILVDMGAPILDSKLVPADKSKFSPVEEKDEIIDKTLTVDGKDYGVTCVSMGNPHAVIFIDEEVKDIPIEKIGPMFESNEAFPRRTNTEFVKVKDRKHVDMRVWERGAGETFACGTGACATAVACILNGHTDNEITVTLLGGDLKISWDGDLGHSVFMEGPATNVFEGEIII